MAVSNTQKNKKEESQKIEKIKGRAMLQWIGKEAPKSIEWYPAQEKEVYGDINSKDFNKIFWGDNKQVLAHLLKDYRGKVDLIYIDPPFDSKADYVKKVKVKGLEIQGLEQNVIEQMQYTDIWEKDEYLQFMYERLIIMRELLSDKGSIYLHCDWHKDSYLRLIMDEVFGADNFRSSIIWDTSIPYVAGNKWLSNNWIYSQATIMYYTKTVNDYIFNKETFDVKQPSGDISKKPVKDVWTDIQNFSGFLGAKDDKTSYPTQKPEALLERIIKASSNEGDLVMDCFMGSGTTCAVAQRLGRRWIGCDINKGAILTTTERLQKILKEQEKASDKKDSKMVNAFKVYNVNHYDVFNNDQEAINLIREIYGIEKLSGDFDGYLGNDFVKIVSPNRVLNNEDMFLVIENIKKNIKDFKVLKKTQGKEDNKKVFENKVIVYCSGLSMDVRDFTRKKNKTGVEIEIRDIQVDKKGLSFKESPEVMVDYKVSGKKIKIEVKDYYSPLLMKKLEIENEGRLSFTERTKLFDFRQAIEHIVIDVNYGEGQKNKKDISFNADVFVHKEKKNSIVETVYEHEYEKSGEYKVAVKVVDILGEEVMYEIPEKIIIK